MKRLVLFAVVALAALSAARADTWVNGYLRKDGTYVQGHWRSDPDNKYWNNWSSWGNTNPYTSEKGYNLPKLDDYLQRPSYYDYQYRPPAYTPPYQTPSSTPLYDYTPSYETPPYPLYSHPSAESPGQLPHLYQDEDNSSDDYTSPYEYEYSPSTTYDLDYDYDYESYDDE